MEYDFNIRLSILVGQVWTESKDGKVSPVIRAEQAVFRAWIREGHQGVYRFSQLYLWGIEQADLDLTPIKERLHQLIESQDQLQDIIVALWGQWRSRNQGRPATLSPPQFAPIQD